MLLLGGLLLLIVLAGSTALARDAGETLTRNTVRLSLAWYAIALILIMRLRPDDWTARTIGGSAARWCWTWAVACFLVHVALAFHYYHHWSHADAFERTRQVSGTGEGLYVSYLFSILWTSDLIFWWLAPGRYTARSRWVDRALHAFMLFVVFNGMVVYEEGLIRWAGVAMFLGLALAWTLSQRSERLSAA
jgi:hypothetical protein